MSRVPPLLYKESGRDMDLLLLAFNIIFARGFLSFGRFTFLAVFGMMYLQIYEYTFNFQTS
jgi:hypothetical protein